MAKIAKVKKREVSVHSRAARRAASPPSKPGKSAIIETEYKPWLHSAQNAGIGKKKNKRLTRQQKLRQQRGIEKADTTGDKLEKKVENSKGRARRVQARRADWDDLNEKIVGQENPKPSLEPKANVDAQAVPALDETMADKPIAAVPVEHHGSTSTQGAVAKVVEFQESVASRTPDEVDEIT